MTGGGGRADEYGCAIRPPRAGVAGCEPVCAAAPRPAPISATMLRAMTTANFTRKISGAIERLCRKITAMDRVKTHYLRGRVLPGCSENRRRVRRRARPYARYALRSSPARRAILAATRLAEIMSFD